MSKIKRGIKWFNILTDEKKEKLINNAAKELELLTKSIATTEATKKFTRAIVVAECRSSKVRSRKDRLLLLPGGTLWDERPATKDYNFGYSVGLEKNFQEVARKYHLTPDQLRAIHFSFVDIASV